MSLEGLVSRGGLIRGLRLAVVRVVLMGAGRWPGVCPGALGSTAGLTPVPRGRRPGRG